MSDPSVLPKANGGGALLTLLVAGCREAHAQLQEIEHREKIASLKECVVSMGCGITGSGVVLGPWVFLLEQGKARRGQHII